MAKQQPRKSLSARASRPVGGSVFEKTIVSGMAMGEETWLRHANPWSVWTRFTCLPLLVLAIWSRDWVGIWSLLPIALALFWIWYNPRAFARPNSFDHWPARATFGERIWLNRKNVAIPEGHEQAAYMTSLLALPGVIIMLYGLVVLSIWPTVLGMALTLIAKTWFCDRMVWLYNDMSRVNPVYASWTQRPSNDNNTRNAA